MKKLLALAALLASTLGTLAQGTAFTYQGRLNSGASPASGIYDLGFTIRSTQERNKAARSPTPPPP